MSLKSTTDRNISGRSHSSLSRLIDRLLAPISLDAGALVIDLEPREVLADLAHGRDDELELVGS
jgi:hypothetical protein